MNFVLDIPASLMIFAGALAFALTRGHHTRPKWIGMVLSMSIAAGSLIFLIFVIIVLWNSRG